MDDHREPFGMPFMNHETACLVADQMNRHGQGLWLYQVERHIDDKRWTIVREGHRLDLSNAVVNHTRNAAPLAGG